MAQMPAMPTMPPKPQPKQPAQPHPDAVAHIAAWNDIHRERDQLQAAYRKVCSDLEVRDRHIQELQYQLDQRTKERDWYMAHSIEMNAHMSHIENAARAAKDKSLEMAKLTLPAAEPPVEDFEQQLAELAKGLNGGEPMPSVVTQGPRDHA